MIYDLIIETSIDDLKNNFDKVITESIHRLLSNKLKKALRSPATRREMLEKYGKKAFLLPDKMKFPIIDPTTGKISCKLIYAAYLRANQFSTRKPAYAKIAEKAAELYKKYKCQTKIGIKIHETNEMISLDDLLEHVMVPAGYIVEESTLNTFESEVEMIIE